MRIVRLTAENIKRLKAVEITPEGDVVVISGANGAGKTSILDAIFFALGGGSAQKETKRPIRDGESRAQVTLDLGDMKVTRSWTAKGTTLRVAWADGRTVSSPQNLLDTLVGRLSFDPLMFANQDAKRQLEMLLDLVELPFNPEELDATRKTLYDDRTDVNRDLKRLEAQLAGVPVAPKGTPSEEVSSAVILAELEAAQSEVAECDRHAVAAAAAGRAVEHERMQLDQVNERIAMLTRQLEELSASALLLAKSAVAAEAKYKKARAVADACERPDLTVFRERLASVEDTNRAVRDAEARRLLERQVKGARAKSDDLSSRLASIDEAKAQAMAEAKMPIAGLGFDDDGVTYQGVPFGQCSGAERLRVSLAMAMAMNPEIRVIRVTDASLLDSGGLAIVEQMAADHDYQVWLEIVKDEPDGVSVFIEDGVVAE